MLRSPPGSGCPVRTVIGVVVAARHCCVWGSCVGAGVIAAVLDTTRRGPDAMVMPPDIEAQILRYYHAEKWTAGTIARQLHVHHSVVRRGVAQAGPPRDWGAGGAAPDRRPLPPGPQGPAKGPS